MARLFTKFDLGAVLEARGLKAKEAVDSMNGEPLLNSNPESLCRELEEQFSISVPALKELGTQVDQQEASRGTEIKFFVPFEGDSELFFCKPSSFTLSPPIADVGERELILSYTRLDHDAEAVRAEYYRDVASIREYLEWQQSQVQQFNEGLRVKLRQWVTARRDRLLKDKGMVAALGFPMRRRVDAPQTYVTPTVRRKPAISAAPATVKPFKPEPALDLAEYEHILSVISNMVHVMERSPHAFKDMQEPDLRQHFLVQLNGQYEGQATGETFNFEGKTDILIRAEGKNIFIAECLFWDGPKSLHAKIDQLLGYASWRDTKTALLVFNRQKNFTDVLAKIPEVVKAHPNFKRQEKLASETGFRFILHHRDDKNRELILTVLAFEVPA